MQKLIQIQSLRSHRKLNEQPMGYEAQPAWRCRLTPILGGSWHFDQQSRSHWPSVWCAIRVH